MCDPCRIFFLICLTATSATAASPEAIDIQRLEDNIEQILETTDWNEEQLSELEAILDQLVAAAQERHGVDSLQTTLVFVAAFAQDEIEIEQITAGQQRPEFLQDLRTALKTGDVFEVDGKTMPLRSISQGALKFAAAVADADGLLGRHARPIAIGHSLTNLMAACVPHERSSTGSFLSELFAHAFSELDPDAGKNIGKLLLEILRGKKRDGRDNFVKLVSAARTNPQLSELLANVAALVHLMEMNIGNRNYDQFSDDKDWYHLQSRRFTVYAFFYVASHPNLESIGRLVDSLSPSDINEDTVKSLRALYLARLKAQALDKPIDVSSTIHFQRLKGHIKSVDLSKLIFREISQNSGHP